MILSQIRDLAFVWHLSRITLACFCFSGPCRSCVSGLRIVSLVFESEVALLQPFQTLYCPDHSLCSLIACHIICVSPCFCFGISCNLLWMPLHIFLASLSCLCTSLSTRGSQLDFSDVGVFLVVPINHSPRVCRAETRSSSFTRCDAMIARSRFRRLPPVKGSKRL